MQLLYIYIIYIIILNIYLINKLKKVTTLLVDPFFPIKHMYTSIFKTNPGYKTSSF